MIPKSQRKRLEQKKRNSRNRVINSINNRRIINSQRSNRPTIDNTNRKIINQKRVGFAPYNQHQKTTQTTYIYIYIYLRQMVLLKHQI